MDEDESLQENMPFYRQAMSHAIAYRLTFAQREASNHQLLERKLPNLWDAVHQSYSMKAWESVLAFREALQPVLDLRGYWQQSITLNEWACEGAHALGDALNAIRWTHDRADVLHQQGNYAEAERLYQSCEDAFREIGKPDLALKSRHMRSLVLRAQGRSLEAKRLCTTTITQAKQLNLNDWLAHPLYVQGLLLRDLGAMQQAEHCIEQSLALLTAQPAPNQDTMIAQCYHFLGETALRRGDLAQARSHLMRALHLSQQVGIIRRVAATQRALGDLERIESHFAEAERLYSQALTTATDLNDRPELAKLQLARAKLLLLQHNPQAAILSLKTAYAILQKIGDARGMVGTSVLLGQIYLQRLRLLKATYSFMRALSVTASLGLRLSNLRRVWGWWLFSTRI